MMLILVLSLTLVSCGSITSSPNSYSVTYDGNGNTGGNVPIDSNKYVNGQTVTVLGNTDNLVKIGYAFMGWNTLADGSGATYTQAQTFTMVAANVTLYAIWTTNPTYTVTYDGNGNTGGSVPVDYTNYVIGQIVTVLGNTGNLVRTNYFFAGWNTQADGSGVSYPQAQTFAMGAANVTLYAMWTANPTYTVTYDGNGKTGGSVPVDSTNYEQGQTVTVLGNPGKLVRTNYSFVGWNMQSNGSGTTYTQAQTFTMGAANITLYAMWTANPTYTVTYNGNGNTGGIVPVDSTNYEQGQDVSVLGNTGSLVKTNYSFGGWNTQANGSGTIYTQSQTFTMGAANVTLYAMWTANPTYTVTYNGNGSTGGIVPVDSTNYQQLQTVTVLGNTGNLVKTGNSFAGWNTQADGFGVTYPPAQTFIMGAANVTLYAMWTPTYTVTYLGNGSTGGSAPIDPTNYHIGWTVTVLDNTGLLVRTGYTFAGWNTQSNGSGANYTQSQTFIMGAANVTLYAKWTANNYSVTYLGNGSTGGSAPIDPTSYQIGLSVTVLGQGTLVKTGYTFAGWNTQSNGSGTTYTQSQTFTMGAANVTLYAMWTAINYTVTYNGNGSTGGSAPIDSTNYQIGQLVTVLGTGTLVKTGYSFAGWNTQSNGAGTTYTQSQTFTMGAANVTLYAMWTAPTTTP